MEYRRLGRAGIKVSVVGLGTWLTFGRDQEHDNAVVDAAVDAGINLFDTANTDRRGQGEVALGRALARHNRDNLVIASKVWGAMGDGTNERGLSRKHIRTQCEASLRRLGVDYLDLYQCQRYDPEVTLDEVVTTMSDLVRAGKILHWGVSGWDENQIHNAAQMADGAGREPMAAFQARYNLLDRGAEDVLFPACWQRSIAILAYSPLAQGVLTAKYMLTNDPPPETRAGDERLGRSLRERYGAELGGSKVHAVQDVAWSLGVEPAQVALAWVLRPRAATAALVGATTPEQIRLDAAAAGVVLDDEALNRLGFA